MLDFISLSWHLYPKRPTISVFNYEGTNPNPNPKGELTVECHTQVPSILSGANTELSNVIKD